MKEFILFLHPMFAVFGVIATVWVLVEVLNASEKNLKRISAASITAALFMVLTWITSGYWYIVYYATDKALILKGPWAFAHTLVMETKEHVFFSILILALFLPMITLRNNLATNASARKLVYVVAVLIILSSLALEGAGALISFAVRMSLLGGA
ncbi:hypothetical protein A2950_00050 [Candidatus Kaiserbacteria bacterium RIFCSPLOWO2_01_FULL_55_19]|uniref:DUF2231 domain-containing protein n=1 Tax=Candidatus Kaiserbacteria bacterium RIFCSPLOWO2_01_FULL_55_19 TaxID=1798516 RepID=A0A1F6ES13_9BACT|nr:MAG: hypothetical protein A2950_00050 [Candidatus Kaiserbacteria bacterium RIFCSPLOWO2_01_FULL_55_19]